jgi:HEAT repeat protein
MLKTTAVKLGLLTTLMCIAPVASATTYFVYVPTTASVGGLEGELYSVQGFEAHDGLSGAALVDASMAELVRMVGADIEAIDVALRGTIATVSLKGPDKDTARVQDRALGSVFHTLRYAGVEEVRLGVAALSEDSFTRGALLPIFPMHAALPPRRITHGMIRLGKSLVKPNEFYQMCAVGKSAIRDAIVAALGKGTTSVKLAVMEGLDGVRIKDKMKLLIPRLKDPELKVRLATLALMRDVRETRVLKVLEEIAERDPNSDAKSAAARILVDAGKTAFKKYLLLEKLRSKDSAEVVDAGRELITIADKRLVSSLDDLVLHGNPEVRKVGVEALSSFERYPVMARHLSNNVELNRDAAVPLAMLLIEKSTGRNQASGVIWLLSKGARQEALTAAKVAGERRVPGTTDALGAALKRTEPEVRVAAATALGRLKDARGLESLAGAIRGTSNEKERTLFTAEAIRIIAVQPLDQVIKIAKSPDTTIRELAVKSLAEFARERPNPRVVSVLRDYVADKTPAIRQAAVYALARVKDKSVLDDLVAMQADPDPVIRAQVAHAMSGANHPQADKILIAYLDDFEQPVKLNAIRAVRERKMTAAFDKVKNLVASRSLDIRREVVKTVMVLAEAGDPNLFETYQGLLYDQDAEIRLMAVTGLADYVGDPRVAPAVGGAVTDDDLAVKLKAIGVLGTTSDGNAVEQVIRGLFDSTKDARQVKMAALDALESIGLPRAVKAIQEFVLNETDKVVTARANEVLLKL